jgi:hypothetical protein
MLQCRQDCDESFGGVRELLPPGTGALFHQSQELADVQRHLQRYHALVVSLRQHIREAQSEAGGDDRRLLLLERQLNDGLARALATEPVDMLNVMDDMLKVMSAQVTLRPIGNQFTIEGRDTLLTAAIRAGLNLNYGCGTAPAGASAVLREVARLTATLSGRKVGWGTSWPAHTAATAVIIGHSRPPVRPTSRNNNWWPPCAMARTRYS